MSTDRIKTIDVSSFRERGTFYGRVSLLITVKSFDLQEIRRRYLQSRKNKGDRRGSVERREPATGGIAHVVLEDGRIVHEDILVEMKEPRGIAFRDGRLAVSAETEVFVTGDHGARTIGSPWFSYIHTVDFSPDGNRLLISSSGFDCLFEYDVETLGKTWEWFAWENGFNRGFDPESGDEFFLSRNPEDAGRPGFRVIDNPVGQVLPTAMRAAFINSAVYDRLDAAYLLATFFHEGAVYRIHRPTGQSENVLSGLWSPHGGSRLGELLMATSTGSGEVVFKNGGMQTRYDFSKLPGKPDELEDVEWLQTSVVHGPALITIDSNRTAFVVLDREQGLIDRIPYNGNWAVQDIAVLSDLEAEEVAGLKAGLQSLVADRAG